MAYNPVSNPNPECAPKTTGIQSQFHGGIRPDVAECHDDLVNAGYHDSPTYGEDCC